MFNWYFRAVDIVMQRTVLLDLYCIIMGIEWETQ